MKCNSIFESLKLINPSQSVAHSSARSVSLSRHFNLDLRPAFSYGHTLLDTNLYFSSKSKWITLYILFFVDHSILCTCHVAFGGLSVEAAWAILGLQKLFWRHSLLRRRLHRVILPHLCRGDVHFDTIPEQLGLTHTILTSSLCRRQDTTDINCYFVSCGQTALATPTQTSQQGEDRVLVTFKK